MSAGKKRLFDLNIKVGSTTIILPVFQKQSDLTLIQRIMAKYPSLNNPQSIDKIKNKIVQSLKNIQKSNISYKLKEKIKQFLDRSQIQVKVLSIQQQYYQQTHSKESSLIKKNKKQKKSVPNKQNKYKSESNSKIKKQEFTKIYQITKSIFFKEQKQQEKKQQFKQNVAKILFKGTHNQKKQKLSQSQILQRIQNKIQNYQKNCKLSSQSQFKVSRRQEFNMTTVTQPLNQQSYQPAQPSIQSRRRRFIYNHEQLINDRKLSERKLQAQFRSRSRDPENQIQSKIQEKSIDKRQNFNYNSNGPQALSRSYEMENYSGLRKNYYKINQQGALGYFQPTSSKTTLAPKFNYLNNQIINSGGNIRILNNTQRLDDVKKSISSRIPCNQSSSFRRQSIDNGEQRDRKFKYI